MKSKKMRKKMVLSMLSMFVCCMMCALSVKADVIIEPMDSFYEKHRSECSYENRNYTANGPDGKVILYVSPEIPEQTAVWENGFEAHISFIYEDKDRIRWGIYESSDVTGWMPMDYMDVVYDSISFLEEHASELLKREGELEGIDKGEKFYFWKYPGSEKFIEMEADDYAPGYSTVYVDGQGHSWGHIGYYFGIRDRWVCLDAPDADFQQLMSGDSDGNPEEGSESTDQSGADAESQEMDTGSDGSREAESQDTGETVRIVPKGNGIAMVTAVVMVIAVVGATAVLLIILRRKGSEKQCP